MRFPHTVTIYPSVADEDGFRTPGPTGTVTKAFLIPKQTQDIQRFAGSGSRLNSPGQLSNIAFDVFFPLTVITFDGFSELSWDGGATARFYPESAGRYEFVGEAEAYTNTGGKLKVIHAEVKRIN